MRARRSIATLTAAAPAAGVALFRRPFLGIAFAGALLAALGALLAALGALLAALGALPSRAQAPAYPARPITLVVPFASGGGSEAVARIVADGMAKALGQSVVIENMGGAGGTAGAARVAAAVPDGFTLLASSMGPLVAAPSLYPRLTYDPRRDFEPIGLTARAPVAIAARANFPAKDLGEFVAYLKANGRKVSMIHGGVGASSHMACLLLTTELRLAPSFASYRGRGSPIGEVEAGKADFLCEQVLALAPAAKRGALKPLAVAAAERSPAMTGAPTAAEAGFPQLRMTIWNGLFAPKGTPKAIVARLAAALERALDDPATAERIIERGGVLPAAEERGPAFLAVLVAADVARWAPLLKAADAALAK